MATTAQLEAIEKAYYSGALRVEYGDNIVWYRTLDEMRQIIADLRATLGLPPMSAGGTRASRTRYGSYRSG